MFCLSLIFLAGIKRNIFTETYAWFNLQGLIALLWVYLIDLMRRYVATHSVEELVFTICPLGILALAVSMIFCVLLGCLEKCVPPKSPAWKLQSKCCVQSHTLVYWFDGPSFPISVLVVESDIVPFSLYFRERIEEEVNLIMYETNKV